VRNHISQILKTLWDDVAELSVYEVFRVPIIPFVFA